ncbi:MAG: hypothetical protein OXP71_02580 [Candidatus Poribacteria bacterium]|nr:hypothetical protein [Candidatus Poribacteria bacterium]
MSTTNLFVKVLRDVQNRAALETAAAHPMEVTYNFMGYSLVLLSAKF